MGRFPFLLRCSRNAVITPTATASTKAKTSTIEETSDTLANGVVAWIESRPSFPMPQMDYAAMLRRRTESGRPASSIRLRTATPTAASAC